MTARAVPEYCHPDASRISLPQMISYSYTTSSLLQPRDTLGLHDRHGCNAPGPSVASILIFICIVAYLRLAPTSPTITHDDNEMKSTHRYPLGHLQSTYYVVKPHSTPPSLHHHHIHKTIKARPRAKQSIPRTTQSNEAQAHPLLFPQRNRHTPPNHLLTKAQIPFSTLRTNKETNKQTNNIPPSFSNAIPC